MLALKSRKMAISDRIFFNKFILFGSKDGGIPKISFLGPTEMGEKHCTEKKEERGGRRLLKGLG